MIHYKKWVRLIGIAVGMTTLTFFAQKNDIPQIPDKAEEHYVYVPPQKKDSSQEYTDCPQHTSKIQGKITEIHDTYGYYLVFKSVEENLSYTCNVPEEEKSKKFKVGDIISVSYCGMVLESAPAQLEGVISIEIE